MIEPVIDKETFELYKTYCDINDEQLLKKHLMSVQQGLLSAVRNYKCIREYKFAFSRIYYRFFYNRIIQHAQQLLLKGQEPYFLDVGCCTGTDLRKLYVDGYPKSYLIGLDIEPSYIQSGHRLFKDDKDTCPIQFTVADLFKDDLKEYASKISIVHAGSILHLFDSEDMHRAFVRQIKKLLKPGGLFVGGHVIANEPTVFYRTSDKCTKYYVGVDSFKDMLASEGFQEIELQMTRKKEDENDAPVLYWVSFLAVFNPTS